VLTSMKIGMRLGVGFAVVLALLTGIAITYNHTSSKFVQRNPGALGNQTQLEAAYRAQVKSWFALQPTVQYIVNPNMDPARKNVWLAGVRAEIVF